MNRSDFLDCTEPGVALSSLFARSAEGGVPALFAGRRVRYSFNTRVAIRRVCNLLRLVPGDEVLAPAYNCGSELDPLLSAGLILRLYPVDEQTQIDPAEVALRITPKTRAIYLIHYFGFLHPSTAAIRQLCDDHGLWLIEDCALSLLSGSRLADGRAGDVSLFCFYKLFPVLGGGALVVNAANLTEDVEFFNPPPREMEIKTLIRAGLYATLGRAGMSALRRLKPEKKRLVVSQKLYPDMPPNYYFDPALADMRISFLAERPIKSFDIAGTIAVRRANYRTYQSLLADMPGVTMLYRDLPEDTCPLNMPVLVQNRDALARALTTQGIGATPWWAGFHRDIDFSMHSAACHLKRHVLALPLHQALGPAHIAHIVKQLREFITTETELT